MVVADDDDTGSRPGKAAQGAGEMIDSRRIEIVGRLVEQDKIGRGLQNCPQGQVMPLPTRQAVEPVIEAPDQPRRRRSAPAARAR